MTEVRDLHASKTKNPILFNLFGSVIEIRDIQELNALFPTRIKVSGSETEVRRVQAMKELSPIVISLVGKMMEVRRTQLWNAFFPIWITVSGIKTL